MIEGTPAPAPDASLPAELVAPAQALEAGLRAGMPVDKLFSDFCSRAYVKPDWAGPASDFLAGVFEGRETELAAMTRVPDLIIELASGQQTLTTIVAFEWAAAADTARMAKLAEALAATHGKMHNPEVVHLMLALATSLAVTRYSRAEQMLSLAEPQAAEEHQEGLAEARQWLAAGRILRGCGQDVRDLWNHRLRRRRTVWTWDSPAERAALVELADHLKPGQEGVELFQAVVPAIWWDVAMRLAAERAALRQLYEQRQVQAAADAPPGQHAPQEAPPHGPVLHSLLREGAAPAGPAVPPLAPAPEPQVMVLNAWPFFFGGLFGAATLACLIAVSPYDLKKPPRDGGRAAPAAGAAAAGQLAPQADPASQAWVEEQLKRAQGGGDDVKVLFEKVRGSTWEAARPLLAGETPELPPDDARRLPLLVWLHLDPPQDTALQAVLPAMLADVRADGDTLELWERLAASHSPMEKAVREAARRQIYSNADAWSPRQEEQLNQLGWPVSP